MTEETKSAREIIKDIIKSCHIMNFNNDEPMMEVAANVLIFKLTEAFEAGQRSKQLPEFTQDQIGEFCIMYLANSSPIVGELNQNKCINAYYHGFEKAVEQMKKKMGE